MILFVEALVAASMRAFVWGFARARWPLSIAFGSGVVFSSSSTSRTHGT